MKGLCIVIALATGGLASTTGCQTTRFHQRARLADRCMKFDVDGATTYIRTKAEAAREGALGGFGMSPAGGCGCE